MKQRRTYLRNRKKGISNYTVEKKTTHCYIKACKICIYVTSGRLCQSCRKGNRCQNRFKNNVRPTCAIANTLGEETQKQVMQRPAILRKPKLKPREKKPSIRRAWPWKALLRRRCNNRTNNCQQGNYRISLSVSSSRGGNVAWEKHGGSIGIWRWSLKIILGKNGDSENHLSCHC